MQRKLSLSEMIKNNDLEDVAGAMIDLGHLIDLAHDIVMNMGDDVSHLPYRRREIGALLIAARNWAQTLADDVETFDWRERAELLRAHEAEREGAAGKTET